MTNKLSALFTRAKDIYQKEGLITLVMQVILFLFRQYRVRLQYRKYYLYDHTIKERNEADFMPRIKDFTFKIITSNEQAD